MSAPPGQPPAGSPLAGALERLADRIGHALSWLTLGMVLGTCGVAVLRYFFDIGATWLQEAVTWMHAFVFLGGASYALRADEHVRVDVFHRNFSARGRAIVNVAGVLLLLWPFCGYLVFESWAYVWQSFSIRETSREANGLPALYVLKSVILAAAVLLAVQGLAMLLRALAVLRAPRQA